jgi:glyceraldehyde-3-phosphate dehydrogenase (NAD(P))
MTGKTDKICVAVNGYGVIGKRVADAVAAQSDMELLGIADVETDWRMRVALRKGFKLFGSLDDRIEGMLGSGLEIAGTLDDLLEDADIVVDCTPKGIPAKNAERYRVRGIKFIVQGGREARVDWALVRC